MKANRLINAVQILIEEHRISSDKTNSVRLHREEIAEIISEYLEDIYLTAGVSEIERRLNQARNIDTKAIGETLKAIESARPADFELPFSEHPRNVSPSKIIEDLKASLQTIESKQTQLGRLEVLLRLEMFFDSQFNDLMMAFQEGNKIFEIVTNQIRAKLTHLSDDQALLQWATIKSQFSQNRFRTGFVNYPEIIPESFWKDTNDVNELRNRYARFLAEYKPRTIFRMIQNGLNSYPAGLAGIARILGIQEDTPDRLASNLDVLLIRVTSRIVAIYQEITKKEVIELAKIIGADGSGLIFSGEYFTGYKGFLANSKPDLLEVLSTNMRRLTQYVEETSVNRTLITDSLWQYKLGQEIMCPGRNKIILKKNELILQREVSKFLIERGILSFGRTFGRSEIDLYTQGSSGEDFVVEVKVYRKTPRSTDIENNVVQLLSYMSQVSQPRGILLIYNCSDDLVVAQRKWIRGRIWILPINLCESPPSKRVKSLEIHEATDANRFLLCIENGRNPLKKSVKKRNSSFKKIGTKKPKR